MTAMTIPCLADILQPLVAQDVVPELGNDHQPRCVFDARRKCRRGHRRVAQPVLGPEGVVVCVVPGSHRGKKCL